MAGNTYRAICYVDGFNLFYGLRDVNLRKYYWLDVQKLAVALLRPDQRLSATKYFTARIRGSHPKDNHFEAAERAAKRLRQVTYLEALGTLHQFDIVEGLYRDKWTKCPSCKSQNFTYEEKKTDVALASEFVSDAFLNRFDVALVISGDIDLVPAVEVVRKHFPEKWVTAVFPPGRIQHELRTAAGGHKYINKAMLAASQFPETVIRRDGFELHRPLDWC